jgi:hypothetical protein
MEFKEIKVGRSAPKMNSNHRIHKLNKDMEAKP